jgi:hypothetical protein
LSVLDTDQNREQELECQFIDLKLFSYGEKLSEVLLVLKKILEILIVYDALVFRQSFPFLVPFLEDDFPPLAFDWTIQGDYLIEN